ncbi:uracil-DNA glycosylase [Acidiferrobacter sp.]|uniref:uracil-DNA glycosylase n=1 Tax=Acidiferrobacter sp. TaxID=1872107 RepID=UPI002629916D|nr:uracil-DNA glycosylase [Acidiferrobacter sp.]
MSGAARRRTSPKREAAGPPGRTAALSRCRQCPRLAAFRDEIKDRHPEYYCRPVPMFGDESARLVIVGLAPGLHGANATGRPFTGDYAGILLYETLHRLGIANRAQSLAVGDGLVLTGARITNAVKCVPPANRPTAEEIRTCAPYLNVELAALPEGGVIMALGRIAHEAVLRAFGAPLARHRFAHGARHEVAGRIMWDSYHCSRYNTQTRRLTPTMFEEVLRAAAREVS